MASLSQQHILSEDSPFQDDAMPRRGFIADLMQVMTQPATFFPQLGTRNGSNHTLWLVVILIAIIAFHALQISSTATAVSTPPVDGAPFESGFPVDGDGFPLDGGAGAPTATTDPMSQWLTALTAIGAIVLQWGALSLLLAEVTMFNAHRPNFQTNLRVAIWASVPLALMLILQIVFVMGGGTMTNAGFSGFLSQWSGFSEQNIYVQSFIHALASQLTLFWLWGLYLVYLGARLTLRGKRPVVLLIIAMWVLIIGTGYAVPSYQTLRANNPSIEEPLPETLTFDSEMPVVSDMVNGDGTVSEPIEEFELVPEGDQ